MRLRRVLQAETRKLRKILEKKLKQYGYDPVTGQHYIWAEGTLPAVLVAHMDTVHPVPPDRIFYDPKERVMWSPQGLGADDRAGVWAILCLLEVHGFYTNDRMTQLWITYNNEVVGVVAPCRLKDQLSHVSFQAANADGVPATRQE